MTDDLEALRRRSAELDAAGDYESDEVVRLNRTLFEADPAEKNACYRLGVALQYRRQLEEASEVLERGLAAEPRNGAAESRLALISQELRAKELIESAFQTLDRASRAACISFMAASIREIVDIDGDFLAVAESDDATKFRIWCGMVTACAPGEEGTLSVMLHAVDGRSLIDRIKEAGGIILPAEKNAVPNGEWVGIPIARLEELRDEVLEAHRRLLPEAIAAGKNPNLARNRDDLRKYILSEAEHAE